MFSESEVETTIQKGELLLEEMTIHGGSGGLIAYMWILPKVAELKAYLTWVQEVGGEWRDS